MAPTSANNTETTQLLAVHDGGDNSKANNGSSNHKFPLLHSLSSQWEEQTSSVGMLGSFSIAVNSLTGPAMLNLPATFQRCGLIPTTLTIIFVCILSALCSLHMADTISKVPGNRYFTKEVEFAEPFRVFWGYNWFVFAQILFFCCITCLNMSSIVDTAQVVDTFLGHVYHSTALKIIFPSSEIDGSVQIVSWDYSICTKDDMLAGECIPFINFEDDDNGTTSVILTLGYIITSAFFIPLALLDLKENCAWQILGFIVLMITSIQFAISFVIIGIDLDNVSIWGTSWDTLFGVVLFNFALVLAIPAWLHEKNTDVDVPTVVHGSSVMSIVLYMIVGALGSCVIPNVSENMLQSMMSGIFGKSIQIGSSIFAFFIIGLGVPLFSVFTRYSLFNSGILFNSNNDIGNNNNVDPDFDKQKAESKRQTNICNIFAVYLPFSVAWMLYQGRAVTQLLAWGGVICTSVVAFILPLLIAYHTVSEFYHDADHIAADNNNTDDETRETHDAFSLRTSAVSGSSFPVYFGYLKSRRSQLIALRVLLVLASLSVLAAIVGNIIG